jgi:hypothetical protein
MCGGMVKLVVVSVSATGIAEFFIGPAPKRILAPKAIAGWFCKMHSFF